MYLYKEFNHPKISELTVKFFYDFEHMPYKDHFDDPRDIEWIEKEIERGNDAAWFIAKIQVCYHDITSTDYLGGCSYKSFDEFLADDYCTDMINTASRGLLSPIKSLMGSIESVLNKLEKQYQE